MARPVTTSLPDQSATLRQLKVLVVVLIFSNIGLGAFSFYLLRRIDRQYSGLIAQNMHVLNNLQTQTAAAVEAMRGTNMIAVPAADRTEAAGRARTALLRERKAREALLAAEWLHPESEARIDFKVAGDAFTEVAGRIVAAVEEGRSAEADRERNEMLRPIFDRYLVATTKAADILFAESVRVNEELSAKTGSLSAIVLGLGSWPVAILCALLLLTAVFVIVLMILFRGREMSDMP